MEIIEGKPFQGVEYLSPQCPSPYQSSGGTKREEVQSKLHSVLWLLWLHQWMCKHH